MDQDKCVLFSIEGDIAVVTLNRDPNGNAIDMAMAIELAAAVRRCVNDKAIRCVVLTARGKLFCGGGDIRSFASAGAGIPAYLQDLASSVNATCAELLRMSKPLVVLVNGPAGGIGVSLAILGDYVLCADTAHFTAAYGGVGLTPDGGLSWTLPRLVGLRNAQRMIIGNERIAADEAAKIGLVTRVIAADRVKVEGMALAARLATMPVAALGMAKQLLVDGATSSLEAHLACEVKTIARAGDGAEAKEGFAAFLERRKPDFKAAG